MRSLFACSVLGLMFVCVRCRFYIGSTLVTRLCFLYVLAFFVSCVVGCWFVHTPLTFMYVCLYMRAKQQRTEICKNRPLQNTHKLSQKRRWDFGTFLLVDCVSVRSLFACSVSVSFFVCVLCRFYVVSTLVPVSVSIMFLLSLCNMLVVAGSFILLLRLCMCVSLYMRQATTY